jgi:hypothetical protein
MNKGSGKNAQNCGQKRRSKVIARKKKHVRNLEYIVKLMQKYGSDLKLTEKPPAGTKFLQEYLRPTQKEENVQESN